MVLRTKLDQAVGTKILSQHSFSHNSVGFVVVNFHVQFRGNLDTWAILKYVFPIIRVSHTQIIKSFRQN